MSSGGTFVGSIGVITFEANARRLLSTMMPEKITKPSMTGSSRSFIAYYIMRVVPYKLPQTTSDLFGPERTIEQQNTHQMIVELTSDERKNMELFFTQNIIQ